MTPGAICVIPDADHRMTVKPSVAVGAVAAGVVAVGELVQAVNLNVHGNQTADAEQQQADSTPQDNVSAALDETGVVTGGIIAQTVLHAVLPHEGIDAEGDDGQQHGTDEQ